MKSNIPKTDYFAEASVQNSTNNEHLTNNQRTTNNKHSWKNQTSTKHQQSSQSQSLKQSSSLKLKKQELKGTGFAINSDFSKMLSRNQVQSSFYGNLPKDKPKVINQNNFIEKQEIIMNCQHKQVLNKSDKYELKIYMLDQQKQPYDVNGLNHKNQSLMKRLELDDLQKRYGIKYRIRHNFF